MGYTIAVQPDYLETDDGPQSFSERCMQVLDDLPGFSAKVVNVYADRGIAAIEGCDAFLWRGTGEDFARDGRKIIPAIEYGLGVPAFPSPFTIASNRDKVAQQYLLEAVKLPTPRTWIFHDLDGALAFLEEAAYPLVMKMPSGYGSNNVAKLTSRDQARRCCEYLFGNGVKQLWQAVGSEKRLVLRRGREALGMLMGKQVCKDRQGWVAFFQEFLEGNEFDTRVMVMGRYACAIRRYNRPGDFRSSGSGQKDWDRSKIDPASVELAFDVSRRLRMPFVAVDVLYRDGEPVICEINFSYYLRTARQCPGYWFLEDGHDISEAEWKDGSPKPEDWTLHEFLRLSGLLT